MSWAFSPLLPGSAQLQSGAAAFPGYVKVWMGSAWVYKPVKVWDGSQWVIEPAKWYNTGTSSWTTTTGA